MLTSGPSSGGRLGGSRAGLYSIFETVVVRISGALRILVFLSIFVSGVVTLDLLRSYIYRLFLRTLTNVVDRSIIHLYKKTFDFVNVNTSYK